MAHVLTIKLKDGGLMEVHMLNPGQQFPHFGGSKHALVIGKTASLVTRTKTIGTSDFEQDIYAKPFWEWMTKVINSKDDTFEAVLPE